MRIFYFLLSSLLVLPAILPAKIYSLGEQYLNVEAWLLGTVASLLASIVLYVLFRGIKLSSIPTRVAAFGDSYLGFTAILIGMSLTTLIASYCFNFRPYLIDEIAQLFQAKIFAAGKIKATLPPLPQFFYTPNIIYESVGVYSQYPPLNSLLLAIGVIFEKIYLIPILVSGVAIYFAGKFYLEILPRRQAQISMLLLACCPFYQFLASTLMNHNLALLLIATFAYYASRYLNHYRSDDLFKAGFAVGLCLATRPLEGLAVGACFLLWILTARSTPAKYWDYAKGVLGAIVGPALYLGYNFYTTGSLWTTGYTHLWGAAHQLGFHANPWGVEYTPLVAINDFILDFKLLSEFLLETCWLVLIVVPVFFLTGKNTRWDARLLVLTLIVPIAYLFYWHRDALLGPRYLHLSILFLLPLIVRSLATLQNELRGKDLQLLGKYYSYRGIFNILIVLTIIYSCCYGFPARIQSYAKGLKSFKQDLPTELQRQGINKALVFIPVSFGHRLIAQLRTAGITAADTEMVYRRADHCDLLALLENHRAGKSSEAEFKQAIDQLIANPSHVQKFSNFGDNSLRLRPDRKISEECKNELVYDEQGFTAYAPYLTDNQPDFKGAYVFAADLHTDNALLIKQYPGYPVYFYRNQQLLPSFP